jgi:hypothetical protein
MTDVVRPSGTALDGTGDDAEIGLPAAGATLDTAAPAGLGLTGIGLAGTQPARSGLADAGLAGTGQDATETAPLAALTARWDRALAGLDGLAAPEDDDKPGGPPPGRRPASHSRRRRRQMASTPDRFGPASGLGSTHPRVARGLLMTPWFAAATGSVIAASLWIYSPHPQLTYPGDAIGRVPCTTSGCGSPGDRQGTGGSLTTRSRQPLTQPYKSAVPAKTRTRTRASTAASGLTFGYSVRPAADGKFWLTVTITGKHPVKDWQLAFVLPGAHIQSVYNADWHAAGGDGGTASQFTGGPGGGGSGNTDPVGDRGDYGPGGTDDPPLVFFTVLASGKPVGPADCSFDGAKCTFTELSSASQGMR